MAEKTKRKSRELPPELVEAIDAAATEVAAETNLTKAEAREKILGKIQEAADAGLEEVEEAAEEVEEEAEGNEEETTEEETEETTEEETEEETEGKDKKDKKPKVKRDERPPSTHWADRKWGGKR